MYLIFRAQEEAGDGPITEIGSTPPRTANGVVNGANGGVRHRVANGAAPNGVVANGNGGGRVENVEMARFVVVINLHIFSDIQSKI